jgi:hypothetical protein
VRLGRFLCGMLVAPLAALALLVTAPAAVAATPALASSNCTMLNLPGGYTFTLTGTGFAFSTPLVVRWADNVNPNYTQFVPVATDAQGAFTTQLFGATNQNYPVGVRVFDAAGVLLASTTVTCGSPPPPPPPPPPTGCGQGGDNSNSEFSGNCDSQNGDSHGGDSHGGDSHGGDSHGGDSHHGDSHGDKQSGGKGQSGQNDQSGSSKGKK